MAAAQAAWMIPSESADGDELAHLQRLYRICEGDRRAYCSNTKATLLKQRKIILKLEGEKREHRHSLDEMDARRERVLQDKLINALVKQRRDEKRKLAEKRELVEEQKEEIRRLEEKTARARCVRQASRSRADPGQDSRRVTNLEDRLEIAFVHFNRLLHRNGNSRRHIEHLVQQKNMHKFISKQLTETLTGYKSKIEEAMVSANETCSKRDDAYQKMQTLRSTRDHEHQVCGALLQEARRNVEQHRNFVDFLTVKHRKRPRGTGSGLPQRDGGSSAAGRETKMEMAPERLQQQRGHWNKVTANFELFTYCSNLNNKVKTLQKRNGALKARSTTYSQTESDNERKREEDARKAQTELSDVEEALQEAEAKLSGMLSVLRKLKAGIENMLYLVGGDNAAGRPPARREQEQEDEEEISEAALKAVLQEIEDQVNVLLQTRRFMEISEQQMKEQERTLSSTKIPSASMAKAAFFHPERDDIADIEIPSLPIIPSLH